MKLIEPRGGGGDAGLFYRGWEACRAAVLAILRDEGQDR
jgi:hypothetical protein